MQDRKKSYRGNCRTVGMALSAALVLAACQDSSGPVNDAEFDAVRARADYAALESVLNAAAVRSFEATSSRISATTSGGVSVLPLADGISALATPSTRRTGAERLLRDAGAIAAGLPLISPFNRGATFVWDAARGDYAKSTRSGAPGNGVRFILYATDGATGKPDPARERGYADLVDTGSPTGPDIALRLVAVYEGITFLDYGLTLVARTGGGRLEVTGFVRDAENRVDFDIDVEGARDGASDRVDVTFAIEIEARDFRVVGQVRGVEDGTGRGEVDVTVRHGADSIRTIVQGDGGRIDATFYINGTAFATARGDQANPVIRRPDGSELSALEVEALVHIVRITGTLLEWLGCLVEPVGGLVALAILL